MYMHVLAEKGMERYEEAWLAKLTYSAIPCKLMNLPSDKHSRTSWHLLFEVNARTVGPKNIHSSSGWAVIRSTRFLPIKDEISRDSLFRSIGNSTKTMTNKMHSPIKIHIIHN